MISLNPSNPQKLPLFAVYQAKDRPLCTIPAKDESHALALVSALFTLEADAFAQPFKPTRKPRTK